MKVLILTLSILSISASCSFAQDSLVTTTQTWFVWGKPFKKLQHLDLYVSPEVQFARLAGGYAPVTGVSAMVSINKKWGVGAAAYSTFENYTPKKLSAAKAYNFDAQFGGLKLEYTPKPDARVHVSFPLLIGGARARIDSAGADKGDHSFGKKDLKRNGEGHVGGHVGQEDKVFFVIQPGINLETNVFRSLKLFAGANYRIAAGKNGSKVSNSVLTPKASQFNGLSASFGVKVVIFDFAAKRSVQ